MGLNQKTTSSSYLSLKIELTPNLTAGGCSHTGRLRSAPHCQVMNLQSGESYDDHQKRRKKRKSPAVWCENSNFFISSP
jgi:hypothetical protein